MTRSNIKWLGGFGAAAVLAVAVVTVATRSKTVSLWAIGEMVRVNPETGQAFEDNAKQLPGGLSGDYRLNNAVWTAKDKTVRLAAARNEVVAFQVIIEGKAAKVAVAASDLRGPQGATIPAKQIKLFRQWYVWINEEDGSRADKACMAPLGPGWYPDVAIPLTEPKFGNGFSIPSEDFHTPDGARRPAQKNQAIWVDLHVPIDARPGAYDGTITVTADGRSQKMAIVVDVWDFAIPPRMNMHAELMNYGETAGEPTPVMAEYFKLAHQHRTFISDNGVKPAYDGSDYDWTGFDKKFGPLFTGEWFTEGPGAGRPIPFWSFPIDYSVERPDKKNKKTKSAWPLAAPASATNFGVEFTEQFKKDLARAVRKWDGHFVQKGWTRTRQGIYQDSLDEPGLHKSGEGLQAGREQAATIYETARIVREANPRVVFYKLDIGGGNTGNKLDLDGNGKVEGAIDVANYFGPVVDVFSIHGLCVDVEALKPYMTRPGAETIFYNGYHPRVGPNTIHGELLGYRTWAVTAWRSGLAGWADWHFRREDGRNVFYEPNETLGKTMYLYRGDHIGADGKVFASLRLKAMRRGAQDFELLRLLALKDGSDRRAQNIAAMVCGAGFLDVQVDLAGFQDDAVGAGKPYSGVDGDTHWSHDPAAWTKFHRLLGDAIAEKQR